MSRAPAFARDFPEDPGLARLVAAFAEGDYRAVRAGVPALIAKSESAPVKAAAEELLRRTTPDPASKVFLLLTLALLVFLSGWWIWNGRQPRSAPEQRQIEYVK